MWWLVACVKPVAVAPAVEAGPPAVIEPLRVSVEDPAVLYERIAQDAEDGEAWFALARLHLQAGDEDLAEICAARASVLGVADASLDNDRGVAALHSGDTPRALRAFRAALAEEPDHVDANLNVGALALQAADYVEARQRFGQVLVSQPAHSEALLGMAAALAGSGEVDAALERVDGYLAASVAPEPDAFALKDSLLAAKEAQAEALVARRLAERQAAADVEFVSDVLATLEGCDELIVEHLAALIERRDPAELRSTAVSLQGQDTADLRAAMCP